MNQHWFSVACAALALGCNRTVQAQAAPELAPIPLKTRTVLPEAEPPELEAALLEALHPPRPARLEGSGSRVHAILQFAHTLEPEDFRTLEAAGLVLCEWLGREVYLVGIPTGTDLDAGELGDLVRWGQTIRPADRIAPDLARGEVGAWALLEDDRIYALVQFFPDVSEAEIRRVLGALDLEGELWGANAIWRISPAQQQLLQLGAEDIVLCVSLFPPPAQPTNLGARAVTMTEAAQSMMFSSASPWPVYRGSSGDQVKIGLGSQGGIDTTHLDFKDLGGSGQRVYFTLGGSGDAHDTHVASIALGNGLASSSFFYPKWALRGHAPEAWLGDYADFGGNVVQFHQAIVKHGTNVTNHSYKQSDGPYYAKKEASIDRIIRGDAVYQGAYLPSQPQVWSAGNEGVAGKGTSTKFKGYYSVRSAAKNAIAVGSVDVVDGQLSDFSSLGPTLDGRIKPDLVAPGAYDWNGGLLINKGIVAASKGPDEYQFRYGTSMATPAVTGIVALMMERYADTFPGGFNGPRASTYKALLIHTAEDRVQATPPAGREITSPDTGQPVAYHAGPDWATGWGLVNAQAAVSTIAKRRLWREGTLVHGPLGHTICIQVPPGEAELKVTLVWDDLPGGCFSAQGWSKLINDLDLALMDPAGQVHSPWTLQPPPSDPSGAPDPIDPALHLQPAVPGVDRRNNVEMVTVANPQAGRWEIHVRAWSLPMGGPQTYSLVSSVPMRPLCVTLEVPSEPFCSRFPQFCAEPLQNPIFEDPHWILPPGGVLELRSLCGATDDCRECMEPVWRECSALQLRADEVPVDGRLVVFDTDGRILAESPQGGAERTLEIPPRTPGTDLLLLLADGDSQPYADPVRLSLDLTTLD